MYRRQNKLSHAIENNKKKVEKIKNIINAKQTLTPDIKNKLLDFMTLHVDDYTMDVHYTDIEQLEREMYRDVDLEIKEQLLEKLMQSRRDSDEEDKILTELLELYIPEFVNKQEAIHAKEADK